MKPISAEIMAEIDRRAQEEFSIPQIVLMENAGRSVSEDIIKDLSSIKDKRIAVFCGKGNNGGDGFVIARYLADKTPGQLIVYVMDSENIRQGAALENFEKIRKMELDIRPMKNVFTEKGVIENMDIGVDSIFGTGFKGELPEDCAALGSKLNLLDIRVYAVDVPSGLDATTGVASKDCPRADRTITFGLPKQGFFQQDGPDVCGEIVVKDIGFPRPLLEPYL